MTAYTIYADTTAYQTCHKLGDTWSGGASNVVDANGGSSAGTGFAVTESYVAASNKTTASYQANQAGLAFDCSSIPSSETVTAVTLYLRAIHTGGAADGYLIRENPAYFDVYAFDWGTPTTDWRSRTTLAAMNRAARLSIAQMTALAADVTYGFTENGTNFQTAIRKGAGAARTKIIVVGSLDEATTAPTGTNTMTFYQPNDATASNRPYLQITTTAGGGGAQPSYGWGVRVA